MVTSLLFQFFNGHKLKNLFNCIVRCSLCNFDLHHLLLIILCAICHMKKRRAWNVDNTTSLQPGDICLLERNDAFSKKRLWPLVRVVSLIEARDKKFREALVQLGDADYKLNTHNGKKVYTVLKKPTVKKVSIQQLRRLQSWSQNKVTSAQPEDAGTLASRISHRKVVLTNIVQHNHVPYENRS